MCPRKKMIGSHPSDPHIFDKWLECEDMESETEWSHRTLTNKIPNDSEELIEWLGEKLLVHHYTDNELNRLKRKLGDIGFPEYAEQYRKLPIADKTKKGNATEVILLEYIEGCFGRPLTKTFRLRYNTNVDQSMKGDDVLLVDVVNNDEGDQEVRVYLGEAKFRTTTSREVLRDIGNALGKEKLPLSFSFLVERLYENEETYPIADILEKHLVDDIKKNGNIYYMGLLLSNENVHASVRNHFTSDNSNLLIISLGVAAPGGLINNAFSRAEELIVEGRI